MKNIESILFHFHSQEICKCANILGVISKMRSLKCLTIECDNRFDHRRIKCPKNLKCSPDEINAAVCELSELEELNFVNTFVFEPIHLQAIIETLLKLRSVFIKSENNFEFDKFSETIGASRSLRLLDVENFNEQGTSYVQPMRIFHTERNNGRYLRIELKTVRRRGSYYPEEQSDDEDDDEDDDEWSDNTSEEESGEQSRNEVWFYA